MPRNGGGNEVQLRAGGCDFFFLMSRVIFLIACAHTTQLRRPCSSTPSHSHRGDIYRLLQSHTYISHTLTPPSPHLALPPSFLRRGTFNPTCSPQAQDLTETAIVFISSIHSRAHPFHSFLPCSSFLFLFFFLAPPSFVAP